MEAKIILEGITFGEVRSHHAVRGNQQDIVERDPFENDLGFHRGILRPMARAVNTPSGNRAEVSADAAFLYLVRPSPRVPSGEPYRRAVVRGHPARKSRQVTVSS